MRITINKQSCPYGTIWCELLIISKVVLMEQFGALLIISKVVLTEQFGANDSSPKKSPYGTILEQTTRWVYVSECRCTAPPRSQRHSSAQSSRPAAFSTSNPAHSRDKTHHQLTASRSLWPSTLISVVQWSRRKYGGRLLTL